MYPKASFIYPKALDRDFPAGKFIFVSWRPLQNKEVEGRGVLGIKGASERGGSKE